MTIGNPLLDLYETKLREGLESRARIVATYGKDYWRRYDAMSREDFRAALDLPDTNWNGKWQPKRFDRRDVTRHYSWAVPSEEALLAIVEFSAGKIVELGAGTGYWARLLSNLDADVVAFDKHPAPSEDNHWHKGAESFFPVQRGGPVKAARYPDRALMLCWPPYGDPFASRTLKAYQNAGGRKLIFIGEGAGGCTGDDAFFTILGTNDYDKEDDTPSQDGWVCVKTIDIPQWWGLHDGMYLYERIKSGGGDS